MNPISRLEEFDPVSRYEILCTLHRPLIRLWALSNVTGRAYNALAEAISKNDQHLNPFDQIDTEPLQKAMDSAWQEFAAALNSLNANAKDSITFYETPTAD